MYLDYTLGEIKLIFFFNNNYCQKYKETKIKFYISNFILY